MKRSNDMTGEQLPLQPHILVCRNIFLLSQTFSTKIQNSRAENRQLDGTLS